MVKCVGVNIYTALSRFIQLYCIFQENYASKILLSVIFILVFIKKFCGGMHSSNIRIALLHCINLYHILFKIIS